MRGVPHTGPCANCKNQNICCFCVNHDDCEFYDKDGRGIKEKIEHAQNSKKDFRGNSK